MVLVCRAIRLRLHRRYGQGHSVENAPHAEKVAPSVVVEVPASWIGDVDAPIVVAVDGDDMQSGGEQVGAFVLLHPGGVAEVAEPGHDGHAGVDAGGQRGRVATVEDVGHEPELVECRHQRLRIDAVVGDAAPGAVDIAAVSPMWTRGNDYTLHELRFRDSPAERGGGDICGGVFAGERVHLLVG